MDNVYLVAAAAFGVVLSAMLFLTAVVFGLRTLASRTTPRDGEPDLTDELDDATLVVLAAAASEALAAPVRLHRAHVHRGAVVDRWSRAGRMDIMISHRVEPKR